MKTTKALTYIFGCSCILMWIILKQRKFPNYVLAAPRDNEIFEK